MGLLDNIATRLGYAKAQPAMPPLLQATGAGQAYTLPDLSMPDAQEELFQRLSWVYGAIMAVATVGAGAAFNVLALQGEKRKDVPNHDFEKLLLRPNPLDSRSEFLVKTFGFYALTGNAYWWLNCPKGKGTPPTEIWVLPPHQIEPIPDGRMFIKGYKYVPGLGEDERTLQPWEVVHFKRFHPRNWFVGLSPIEALATVATGDLKAQQYNTEFFGKNNAKVPGALAFADDVNDTAWAKLQRDIKDGWGGTNRSGAMLLRGVGQGGVQWVQMALSQADMQFLEARTFTKEEIYSIFAPGLASVLDVNATEANAKSGKATFIDMAVYPMHVAIAEKITNNVLPIYGDNLVAEFEDIRIVDRALEMQEQAAYATVHTVNEIREKFYDDKKLDDERGELFPAQISVSTAGPGDEDDEPQGDAMPPMQPLENTPQEQPIAELPPLEDAEAEAVDDAEAMQAEMKAQKELAAWRRYAVKHGAEKAQAWTREHVQPDVAEVIAGRLAAATCAEEVKAAFVGPFLVKAQDDDERRLLRKLSSLLGASVAQIVKLLGDPPDAGNLAEFWPQHEAALRLLLAPEMERIAQDNIQPIIDQGGAVDWTQAAQQASTWAAQHTRELAAGLVLTSRTVVESKVQQVISGLLAVDMLRQALLPFFGEHRAGVIAATETTRATNAGKRLAVEMARASGQTMVARWQTRNDELVCDLCGPNNQKLETEGWTTGHDQPPAHPNCRCGITYHWVRQPRGSNR